MRYYARSHLLGDAVGASVVLTVLARLSGDRWLRFPQLVDGLGRGVPLALLVAAIYGSVVMAVNPPAVLAFERARLDRALLPLDLAAMAAILTPPVVAALVADADADVGAVGGGGAVVVLRDVAVMVLVATVVAALAPTWVSNRELAALAPVVIVVAMGLAGSHANGDIRWWAPLLRRSTSTGPLVLLVALAVAGAGLVEARMRKRALAGWVTADG